MSRAARLGLLLLLPVSCFWWCRGEAGRLSQCFPPLGATGLQERAGAPPEVSRRLPGSDAAAARSQRLLPGGIPAEEPAGELPLGVLRGLAVSVAFGLCRMSNEAVLCCCVSKEEVPASPRQPGAKWCRDALHAAASKALQREHESAAAAKGNVTPKADRAPRRARAARK